MTGLARVAGMPAQVVWLRGFLNRRLRLCLCRCTGSIFYNFFFCQYRADLARRFNMAGQIPVSPVDHELDGLIPFSPGWVNIYLDFVGLWIRMLGFLLERFGTRALNMVAEFLDTMGELYRFAGTVYQKNLSTTARPFYIKRLRFFLIHLFDPHLMCVPSLHVMVVILTYTRFRYFLAELETGEDTDCLRCFEECQRRALDITEAILYVKQHSVNCVAAAMYAMTCFDRAQFPPEEAEDFVSRLFNGESDHTAALPRISGEAVEMIRGHILSLYRQFLSQGQGGDGTEGWEKPLLEFLKKPY